MIGASELFELYRAAQSSVDAEEKRRRAAEFDDAVSHNVKELFDDPSYPRRRRSFGVIKKSFGGYFDNDLNELKRHLIRIGASHVRGEGDSALWYLPRGNIRAKIKRFVSLAAIVCGVLIFSVFLEGYQEIWDAIKCYFCFGDRLVCGCP